MQVFHVEFLCVLNIARSILTLKIGESHFLICFSIIHSDAHCLIQRSALYLCT